MADGEQWPCFLFSFQVDDSQWQTCQNILTMTWQQRCTALTDSAWFRMLLIMRIGRCKPGLPRNVQNELIDLHQLEASVTSGK